MTDYELTRQRHLKDLMRRLPEHLERLTWSADQLRALRDGRLRVLLKTACAQSPWHRARLSGLDLESFDEDRLGELPVMTKEDLMTNFDEIVTDRRIKLDLVNTHLAELATDAYLLDEFHGVASGGSSGFRGVYVWGWDAWADCYLIGLRRFVSDTMTDQESGAGLPVLMIVAAERASHFTSAVGQTFACQSMPVYRFPVTLPMKAIVEGLNGSNGSILVTYPSMLARLTAEAQKGNLRISPRRIVTTAEPLLPEIQRAAREIWEAPLANSWGTSEGGILAMGCYRDGGMHLSDDLVIIETVDKSGKLVLDGSESAKLYLTNLYNPLLPLIRYEITDQVVRLEQRCVCGSAHRRIADIQGRLDDVFTYRDGVVVHPHLFRSVLGQQALVPEYQVRQTQDGAEVLLCTSGPIDVVGLERILEDELTRAGHGRLVVTAKIVDQLPRLGIGKLKRFVPLA